jgi:hypothetical protein
MSKLVIGHGHWSLVARYTKVIINTWQQQFIFIYGVIGRSHLIVKLSAICCYVNFGFSFARYTAKLSYRHPPQVFRHKSRKTNLNSPDSTAHNYLLTVVYWSIILRIKSTNVITRKINTANYSNQNNWSPVSTLNYEINDRVRWPVLTFHNYRWQTKTSRAIISYAKENPKLT